VSESEFLSLAEVRELTGYARHEDQRRTLTEKGIPWREGPRRILVSRYHVREWLAGRQVAPSRGPRLELVR
jgi:hypothetical protein